MQKSSLSPVNPDRTGLRAFLSDSEIHFLAVGLAKFALISRQMAKHPLERDRFQRLLDAKAYEAEVRAIADECLQCAS